MLSERTNIRMQDSTTRIIALERWSRLPTVCYVLWAIASLFYVSSLTSGQPRRFYPLEIKETYSDAQRHDANLAWQAKYMPDNLNSLIMTNGIDINFSMSDENGVESSFKERLLRFNERAARGSRNYWVVASHLQQIGVIALLVGLAAIWKLRLFTSVLLLIVAVVGLPSGAALYGGLPYYMFSPDAYLFSAPLLALAIIFFGLSIYRWRLVPVTKNLVNDWRMLGLGVAMLIIGVTAITSLIVFGGRIKGTAGILVIMGCHLVVIHGWRIVRFHLVQRKSEH